MNHKSIYMFLFYWVKKLFSKNLENLDVTIQYILSIFLGHPVLQQVRSDIFVYIVKFTCIFHVVKNKTDKDEIWRLKHGQLYLYVHTHGLLAIFSDMWRFYSFDCFARREFLKWNISVKSVLTGFSIFYAFGFCL